MHERKKKKVSVCGREGDLYVVRPALGMPSPHTNPIAIYKASAAGLLTAFSGQCDCFLGPYSLVPRAYTCPKQSQYNPSQRKLGMQSRFPLQCGSIPKRGNETTEFD